MNRKVETLILNTIIVTCALVVILDLFLWRA